MRQITFTPHQTSTGIEILSNVCESEFLKSKISDGIDKEVRYSLIAFQKLTLEL